MARSASSAGSTRLEVRLKGELAGSPAFVERLGGSISERSRASGGGIFRTVPTAGTTSAAAGPLGGPDTTAGAASNAGILSDRTGAEGGTAGVGDGEGGASAGGCWATTGGAGCATGGAGCATGGGCWATGG